jgi:ferric-dicitrate binding protein FerR (iron transport regulator)
MDKAKAYRILRSFADGIVPAKYKATVERWLLSGKDSDAVDDAMQKIWEETSAQPDESTARSLQQFQSRRRHTLTPTRHTFGMRRMMRYAAIIVLILMTGAAVWMYTSNHYAQSEKMLECYVPNGKIDTLQLSDAAPPSSSIRVPRCCIRRSSAVPFAASTSLAKLISLSPRTPVTPSSSGQAD